MGRRLDDPDLGILPAGQRLLWDRLDEVPEGFVLYGGTALALQLGHRQSEDFDFFTPGSFSNADLLQSIPFLKDARVTQNETDWLTCVTHEGGVQFDFLGAFDLLDEPLDEEVRERLVAAIDGLDWSRVPEVESRPTILPQGRGLGR